MAVLRHVEGSESMFLGCVTSWSWLTIHSVFGYNNLSLIFDLPIPGAKKTPHNMTQLPPCFTVKMELVR